MGLVGPQMPVPWAVARRALARRPRSAVRRAGAQVQQAAPVLVDLAEARQGLAVAAQVVEPVGEAEVAVVEAAKSPKRGI